MNEHSATTTFVCDGRAPRAARQYVLQTLSEWGWNRRQPVLELLVSELMTNAVVHGNTAESQLTVDLRDDCVRISISDAAGEPPVVRDVSLTATSGRGMQITDQLSDGWGCAPSPHGKVVWFELSGRSTR